MEIANSSKPAGARKIYIELINHPMFFKDGATPGRILGKNGLADRDCHTGSILLQAKPGLALKGLRKFRLRGRRCVAAAPIHG